MLIVVEHPLCSHDIAIVRDRRSDSATFRRAMHRIGLHVCLAATQHLPTQPTNVETPLEEATCSIVARPIVAVAILRAGLMLLEPMLELVPGARVGYLGLRRDEATLQPEQYYRRLPPLDERSSVVLLDPMVATGGSAAAAVEVLLESGARDITLACVLAAPEGIARLSASYPALRIVTAMIDRELDQRGYIRPGLGDAGDRAFGTE
ncbi:MAG: uracil phosphoribosyltransferase [Candidatus Kapaibacterium sp.]|nr:MAG: uracil phosphoribosyltransferase [Candidatus Kapabacteria bacterium]